MKEVVGDIWDYHEQGNWIVITTNGTIKSNGEAVMGRGVALQAKQRFPDLPGRLGRALRAKGNHVFKFSECRLHTFPVKHNWWEKGNLLLIEQSCKELGGILTSFGMQIYMVRPGCANGRLDWEDVKPILEKYLDNRFVVVEKYPSTILTVEGLPQGPTSKTLLSVQRTLGERHGI